MKIVMGIMKYKRQRDASDLALGQSEADAQLDSGGNNIIQQCEQVISSDDATSYATNEVKVNNGITERGSSQVNQQSKQQITD